MKTKIIVKFFGDSQLEINGKSIIIENNKPTRANMILQYLLYHSKEGVSKDVLIKNFFDSEAIANPENNLKVNIHRLRQLIDTAYGEELDLIKVKKSVYYIHPDFEVISDFEMFNNTIKEADLAEGNKKIALLEKAMDLYANEFLFSLHSLPDIAYENIKLKESFLSHMEELIDFRDDYIKNLELIAKAISIYPYDDELYATKLRILVDEKEYKEAVEFYQASTAFFLETMGMSDIASLKHEYMRIGEEVTNSISDICDVKDAIKEVEDPRNAYYCNFISFVESYRVINRLMARMGRSEYLLMCTINHEDGDLLNQTRNALHEAIHFSLRSGDIFTTYNANQYLVLLCNIQQENMELVIGRITDYLKKNSKVNLKDIQFSSISTFDTIL